MNLTAATARVVDAAIRDLLAAHAPQDLIGLSCLAAGADSIFAEAVLDHGGALEVILPAADYRARKVKSEHAKRFDRLLGQATAAHTMDHAESNRAAYETANATMLSRAEKLFAVWDGQAPADQGGTAAVVAAARERGIPVVVIWPEGAERRQG
ncbi:MAG: hypothetical protein KJO75_10830 [Dactylosporangium sp.]|nr:hypothetical protein [Dactylosporangium sp.]